MSELLLDSLEIKGYRCFEHLTIEKLGRVSLIVGKNNVGKTTLLEALRIYADRGRNGSLHEAITDREETPLQTKLSGEQIVEIVLDVSSLFYGRPKLWKIDTPILIGPVNLPENLISIEINFRKNGEELQPVSDVAFIEGLPNIIVKKGGNTFISGTLDKVLELPTLFRRLLEPYSIWCLYIKWNGLSSNAVAALWDQATNKNLNEVVIKSLKIIDKDIEDINFSDVEGYGRRIPMVRKKALLERVPLRSLGEGLNRLVGIASALVNCKDGMLLIDEIESGIHYSVLPDVWRLIFKTARELNVQVFATTHSSDCIYAFQKAAEEDKESNGLLIRLVKKNDKIKAILFDEEDMETVVEQNIEVR